MGNGSPARRRRDPQTGLLVPKRCSQWGRGHHPHWIGVAHTANEPHRRGRLCETDGDLILVRFDAGDEASFKNHDVPGLRDVVGLESRVWIWGSWILRTAPGYTSCYVFSLLPPDQSLEPCRPRHKS